MKIPKTPQFTYAPDRGLQKALRKYIQRGCAQSGYTTSHFKTLLLLKALEQDIMNVGIKPTTN